MSQEDILTDIAGKTTHSAKGHPSPIKWWYENSMLTVESYSSLLLKKYNNPLKYLLLIPMWLIEWFLSVVIVGFMFMPLFPMGFIIKKVKPHLEKLRRST